MKTPLPVIKLPYTTVLPLIVTIASKIESSILTLPVLLFLAIFQYVPPAVLFNSIDFLIVTTELSWAKTVPAPPSWL